MDRKRIDEVALAANVAKQFGVGDALMPLLVNAARITIAHVSASYMACQQSSQSAVKTTS